MAYLYTHAAYASSYGLQLFQHLPRQVGMAATSKHDFHLIFNDEINEVHGDDMQRACSFMRDPNHHVKLIFLSYA
jgi:hypothetical protein